MILTDLATSSETLAFSHSLSFSWTSWAWEFNQSEHSSSCAVSQKVRKYLANIYLLWGGSLAGANGPHGFVGQHDFAPVFNIVCEKRRVIRNKLVFRKSDCSSNIPWNVSFNIRFVSSTLHGLTNAPGFQTHVISERDGGLCTCDEFGLSVDDLLCDAGLSFVQLLTNAGDHTETVLQSVCGLLTNELTQEKQRRCSQSATC